MFLNNPATGLPSSLTADANGNLTFTARWIQSTNGAASAPPMALTGAWFTGGTSTTTKPQLLIEPAGTTSTSWSTAGTGLGINAPSGFTGNLLDLRVGGVSSLSVSSSAFATNASQFNFFLGGGGGNITFDNTGTNAPGVQANRFQSGSDMHILAGAFGQGRIVLRPVNAAVEQRNGGIAQTHAIYNTYASDTNYERLAHTWVSNVCYTRPENAGTGSARLYVPVTGGTTVANLPAAATAGTGARSFVTDANATTFLSTVAGGGSNRVPVVSDGTNWLIA